MASRICRNSARGTMTSAIWKVIDRPCRTILAKGEAYRYGGFAALEKAGRRAQRIMGARPVGSGAFCCQLVARSWRAAAL